jgi:hypothetical protein
MFDKSHKPQSSTALLPITFGVTGHRDVHPDDVKDLEGALALLFNQHADKNPSTPLRLISGLAEGADRIVAEVFLSQKAKRIAKGKVNALHWELIVAMPMPESSYVEDFVQTEDAFQKIKEQAAQVVVIPVIGETLQRDVQYAALGIYLVRHSSILLAVWDGINLNNNGGTSQVVEAKLKGPDRKHNFEAVKDYDVGPVFQFPVRRISSPNTKVSSVTNLEKGYVEHLPDELSWPKKYMVQFFSAFEAYNSAVLKPTTAQADLDKLKSYLSPGGAHAHFIKSLSYGESHVLNVFSALDHLSIFLEKKRDRLFKAVYFFSSIAALCLWTAIEGFYQIPTFISYLGLLAFVYWLYRRVNSTDFIERRLEYRMFAEALRVQIYWNTSILQSVSNSNANELDLSPTIQSTRIVEVFLGQQLHEIGWIKEGLRICESKMQDVSSLTNEFKKEFAKHWITDQLKYFDQREKELYTLSNKTNRLSIVFYVFGVITLLLTILFDTILKSSFGEYRHETAIIAAVAPAVFLLIQNYIEKTAADEQMQNYRRMKKIFTKAKNMLRAENLSNDEFNSVILETGKEAITEAMNWLILKKAKRVSFTL